MKAFFLSIILLATTSLVHAQDALSYTHVRAPRLASPFMANTTVTTTAIANAKFIKVLPKDYMPTRARTLQKLVANYDISKTPMFLPDDNSTYKVFMKEGKDASTTVYNAKGNILKSEQTFKGIRLPYNLSSKVIKKHPGWAIHKVECKVFYEVNEKPIITYKVKLKQGKDIKNLELSI